MDLNNIFWFLAVISSGLAAGEMLGEVFLLGRFHKWFFETGNIEMFRKSYPVFRESKKPNVLYDSVFQLAVLIGTSYFLFLLFRGHLSALPLIGVFLQWLFILIFFGTGFASIEHELFSGNTAQELVDKFLAMSKPSLGVYALLWCASFGIFVLMRVFRS
jgi:hypothetical protein